MEKLNYPCPCGGKIKWKKDKVVIDEIDCGILEVEWCEKCGNSVILRIPAKIARVLHIKPHEEGHIYPEGKNKLVVEI